MFAQLHLGLRRQHAASLAVSLVLHMAMIAWLLRQPTPTFIAPSSVVFGDNGTSVSNVYWLHVPVERVSRSAPDASAKRPVSWTASSRTAPEGAAARETAADQNPGEIAEARAAGSPLGTLYEGSATGDEVRPALPIAYPDPDVDRAELAGIVEGDVIVEITIDERGNIVDRIVLRSMGPALDGKVLAALERWRFRPATRNGVPIPSKQDVHYHFQPT
jgi:TonB family protein